MMIDIVTAQDPTNQVAILVITVEAEERKNWFEDTTLIDPSQTQVDLVDLLFLVTSVPCVLGKELSRRKLI